MLKKKGMVNKQIVGFTKPRKILFFRIKPKPIYKEVEPTVGPATMETTAQGEEVVQVKSSKPIQPGSRKHGAIASKRNSMLAPALAELGIKLTPEQWTAKCKKEAMAIAVVVTVAAAIGLYELVTMFGLAEQLFILVPVMGLMGYMMPFNMLVMSPVSKMRNSGQEIEKDILFAARDMIVSMRSGLPLFNAMATVSSGYGSASKEFKSVIDRVQLGMPMEQAMDEVTAKSKSPTFRRLMLQSSTSIKVGADVINAIQEVVNDVSQESVIELRRYGQKLNAIAMFYMLFGVIFPSMGLAVASIMSTFISFFPIDGTTLIMAAVGIVGLQFVFLKMVTSSRPSFST